YLFPGISLRLPLAVCIECARRPFDFSVCMGEAMQAKISKRTVDALEAGQILADTEIKGFVARRLDSGAASYGFRYRDKTTGKQRWIGLGLHGNITADKARIEAKKRAGEVAASRDPVAEREETRAAATIAKLAETNTVDAILDKFETRYSS